MIRGLALMMTVIVSSQAGQPRPIADRVLIISGPSVRSGHSIRVPVDTTDTAPTAMYMLGAAPHPAWTGRAIVDAFEQ